MLINDFLPFTHKFFPGGVWKSFCNRKLFFFLIEDSLKCRGENGSRSAFPSTAEK